MINPRMIVFLKWDTPSVSPVIQFIRTQTRLFTRWQDFKNRFAIVPTAPFWHSASFHWQLLVAKIGLSTNKAKQNSAMLGTWTKSIWVFFLKNVLLAEVLSRTENVKLDASWFNNISVSFCHETDNWKLLKFVKENKIDEWKSISLVFVTE